MSPAPPELLCVLGLTKYQQTTAPFAQKSNTDIENNTQCDFTNKQIFHSAGSDVKTVNEKYSPLQIYESTPFIQQLSYSDTSTVCDDKPTQPTRLFNVTLKHSLLTSVQPLNLTSAVTMIRS